MTTITKRASDVRTREFNFSQALAAASTSVAAIPIVAKRGRDVPVHFTDPNDFTFEYGDSNPSISMSVQCGLDYFKEGNDLWGLRVVGQGAKYSAILLYLDGTVAKLHPIQAGIADPENIDWNALVPGPNSTALALFYPNRGQGSYGKDYAISTRSKNVGVPQNVSVTSKASGGQLPAASYSYRVAALRADGGRTLISAPADIVISNSGVSNANTITWELEEGAVGYEVYGRTVGELGGLLYTTGGATNVFVDAGTIVPDTSHQPIDDPADLPPPNLAFTVSFYDTTANLTTPIEEFEITFGYSVDAGGNQTEMEDRINPFSQFLRVVSNAANLDEFPVIGSTPITNLGGGDSGSAPTSFDIAKAMDVFRNKQLYRINTFINAGFSDPIVQKQLDAIVQYRGDAVALLDVPSSKQKFQDAIDYRRLQLNLNSTYSSLFSPDILEADLTNRRQIYVPFSGMAAALLARTDRVAGPARSPAGLNRGLVDALKQRYQYDDGQATALFNAQVNYLRTFAGAGIALWEQQTLANEFSALSWLNVRRIVNVIKTASYDYLLYALQEQNSDSLKISVVDGLTSYLQAHKNNDDISSFLVVCDNTNNSAAVANAAIMVVSTVIVPMLAVHEIQLQMAVSRQGLTFQEVLRKLGN